MNQPDNIKYFDRPKRLKILFDNQRPLFYITFNTHHRKKCLANQQCFDAFRKYCERGKDFGMLVGNFVIMPDHIHLIIWRENNSCGLKNWMRGVKRIISNELKKLNIEYPHWQEGFFDHVLRNNESCVRKSEYINQNPVKAGLCNSYHDWAYRGVINQLILSD
ncbi:MAG: transposase [Victivallaceae bacterium]|nr:transposase [Victivallaceae bacterium]